MADVRAEILAASRSRTGWLEGSVQPNESQPFVSKVKSTFEEKTVNQDNKIASNASKSEAVRRLGSKVSSIATLFQSFSPHKSEVSKPCNVPHSNKVVQEKTTQKITVVEPACKVDSQSDFKPGNTESLQRRFNSARAIFEQLGEKSKDGGKFSENSKSDPHSQDDSSSGRYSFHERDSTSFQSNRNSSQSSPDEDLRNIPFCRKGAVHKSYTQFNQDDKSCIEKQRPESLSSPDYTDHCQMSDYTSGYESQYSQIYEEIPSRSKDCSSSLQHAELHDKYEKSMNAQEDKNANTTNSYQDCFSPHSNSNSNEQILDTSFPIYAKVIKKRSKPSSSFNHDVEPNLGSNISNTDSNKTIQEHNSDFHTSENTNQKSTPLNDSWEDIGVSRSSSWKKKAESMREPDGTENQSFYGVTSDLRDAAGETLAEFECREHELFFVEAVLRSQRQGSLDEPFPNHKHNSSVESKVELMTKEEAGHFLSSRPQDARQDKHDIANVFNNTHNIVDSDQSETWSVPNSVSGEIDDDDLGSEDCSQTITFPPGTNVMYEDINYHILTDGHFITELPGLEDESDDDDIFCPVPPKKKSKVKFNYDPIKVYSTYSVDDYDRHNDDVDPVAASAEYELEKRIEKMDVFPVELVKGPEGLGLSIIGMGVGADAGLEKLGIFVKSITVAGAAYKDGRISVNDQIIEVDEKSLVGVTQAYAASVLRNTSGTVKFLIGRENNAENSEIAQLISQSIQADKEQLKMCSYQREEDQSGDSSHLSQGSTPEEGEDAPTVEVFDLTSGSSGSLSPDTDVETLRTKLKEVQYRSALAEADLQQAKEKLQSIEKMESERQKMLKKIDSLQHQVNEKELGMQAAKQQIEEYKFKVGRAQQQLHDLERKYSKAKKIIKEFQKREKDYIQQEDFRLQQIQEKDQEYNALVKILKDRVILLEHTLSEVQKAAGLPVELPYDVHQLTPILRKKNGVQSESKLTFKQIEVDMSDGSDSELGKRAHSPDAASEDSEKRSTVERKIVPKEEHLNQSNNLPDLLEASSARSYSESDVKSDAGDYKELEKGASSVHDTPVSNGSYSKSKMENGLSAPPRSISFAEEIKVAVLEWNSKVTGCSDSNLCRSPQSMDSLDQLSNGNSVEKFIEEHQVVPPSYQHATGENFGYPTCHAISPIIFNENDAPSYLPSTPPIEIPPKKRNMQGDNLRLSTSLDNSREDLIKETMPNFLPSSKLQKPSSLPPRVPERSSSRDRRPNNWQGRPVHLWSSTQVGQWLMVLGMEQYIKSFQAHEITGIHLLNLDTAKLKTLGVNCSNDRSIIKKKLKEMKTLLEKERKAHEKEQKALEKLQKKAEKARKK
ncbi:neurabin-1-like [Uloborus diversus]|uniref:neurabin-1-like n=1 Tax=Uloborus diversus TaxID=327109 RepID=UPI002409C9FA|nr:neurabin-1-like [Uloborus diversus]